MRLVAAFVAWIRTLVGRRRARALLRRGLPRGVGAPVLRPALRSLPVPRLLLHLAALPSPPLELSVVKPDRLRLDAELRVPAERDGPHTAADAPPPAPIRAPAKPRTPLARAPLSRVDPRAFRLDGGEFTFATEESVAAQAPAVEHVWLHPALRRAVVERRRMAVRSTFGMSPFAAEWFALWWAEHKSERHGAGEPKARRPPQALAEWMEEVKEQMLIRRDVAKDEAPPPKPRLTKNEAPRAIAAHAPPDIAALVPPKTWAGGPLQWPAPPRPSLHSADVYYEWRTFIDSLGDG